MHTSLFFDFLDLVITELSSSGSVAARFTVLGVDVSWMCFAVCVAAIAVSSSDEDADELQLELFSC